MYQTEIILYLRNLNKLETTMSIITAEFYKKDLKQRNNQLKHKLNIKDYVNKILYVIYLN